MFTSHLYEARRPISTTRRATGLALGEVNSCHRQLSFAQLLGNLNFKSHSSTGLVTILMSKDQVIIPEPLVFTYTHVEFGETSFQILKLNGNPCILTYYVLNIPTNASGSTARIIFIGILLIDKR